MVIYKASQAVILVFFPAPLQRISLPSHDNGLIGRSLHTNMEYLLKKQFVFLITCVIVAVCVIFFSKTSDDSTEYGLYNNASVRRRLAELEWRIENFRGRKMINSVEPCPNDQLGKRILIVAKARSGSTFLGELFNRNPSVFYSFEPLRVIPDMVRYEAISDNYRTSMSVEILHNLVNCDFMTYYAYHIHGWRLSIFESMALKKACQARNDKCSEILPSDMNSICASYDHMVVKSIRVEDVSTLQNIVDRACSNLEIVFLVRDPRAVATSRKHFKFPTRSKSSLTDLNLVGAKDMDLADLHPANVNSYCAWLRTNIRAVQDNLEWMRNRVHLLRYEDIAKNVTRKAIDLYDFFSMEMSEDVMRWIESNTHAQAPTHAQGTMNTKRNSASTAQAWRHELGFREVDMVQNVCGDVMETLGYIEAKTEEELKDISVPLETTPLLELVSL
ncbi:carbohydrate sulfotransferase 1-like [Saccoglossus kowalevskii]|uniref:Carbohydrate sulfotransferase 1-like n=1 Tax=Saccoglossus kowalevskii TaxID=10224 RepID=A0ABM0MQI0_SACKO|nr:PREDICTED: carbohydrate sulfotransferase 1-like [Saccoglossus kowalevskii]